MAGIYLGSNHEAGLNKDLRHVDDLHETSAQLRAACFQKPASAKDPFVLPPQTLSTESHVNIQGISDEHNLAQALTAISEAL